MNIRIFKAVDTSTTEDSYVARVTDENRPIIEFWVYGQDQSDVVARSELFWAEHVAGKRRKVRA